MTDGYIPEDYEKASKLALAYSQSLDDNENGTMQTRQAMSTFIGWMLDEAKAKSKGDE